MPHLWKFAVTLPHPNAINPRTQLGPRGGDVFGDVQVAVLLLVRDEQLKHLVPRVGEAVEAAGGDGSTQLVERQGGAENLDAFAQPGIAGKSFGQPTLGLQLVDEVVEHFVLILHGLQHGPDFVELGPRDGGV